MSAASVGKDSQDSAGAAPGEPREKTEKLSDAGSSGDGTGGTDSAGKRLNEWLFAARNWILGILGTLTVLLVTTVSSNAYRLNQVQFVLEGAVKENSTSLASIAATLEGLEKTNQDTLRLIEQNRRSQVKSLVNVADILKKAAKSALAGEEEAGKAYLDTLDAVLPDLAVEASASPGSIKLFSSRAIGRPILASDPINKFFTGVDFNDYINKYAATDEIEFRQTGDPQWHPSWPLLLFSAHMEVGVSESLELFIYDFLRAQVFRVTDNSVTDYHAKWSPAGDQIVFVRVENGSAGVLIRNVSAQDLRAGISPEAESPGGNLFRLAGGTATEGVLKNVYHPTYSSIWPWITVTSVDPEDETHRLWMVNVHNPERQYQLFPEREGYPCKGNWLQQDGRHFIVFNEYQGSDGTLSDLSVILVAEVAYQQRPADDTSSPFVSVKYEEVVKDGLENVAPEFAGSPYDIVFASKNPRRADVRTSLKRAVMSESPGMMSSDWQIFPFAESDEFSFEYPDWRSEYLFREFQSFARVVAIGS